jgi:hypothetical protein
VGTRNQSLKQCFEKAAVPKVLMTKPSNWPTFEDTQETVGESEVSQVILGQLFQKPFYVTLVATEDGVHVFQKSNMGFKKLGKGHEFFPYSQITGITSSFHLTWKTCLEFSRASNVDKYGYMDEKETAQFVSLVRDRLMGNKSNLETQVRVASESDPLDKLKKLKDLLESGIISQQEFEEKKKILMDQI